MKKLLCIMLIFMTMLTSGCIQKKVKPTTSRKYLVYNLGELPADLLMTNNDSVREKDLLLVLFEGLVREDKDGKIVPAMAEKIEVSKDKIGYTFKLRKDLHYNDGTSIKADDFKRFFHNILLEKGNIFAKQLYCIFGARDFSAGKVDFKNVGIVAKDDSTLEIRLNNPNENFINILSNPVFTLRGNNMDTRNWKDSYSQIQYSGPFIIKEVNKDGEIKLVKNEKYWRANEIVSNEMLVTSIKDEEKALANFETSQYSDTSKIDVLVSPPISEVSALSTENKTEVKLSQSMYYMNFNLKTKNILEKRDSVDINFRNAIGSIIDRELIIETISEDVAVPTINYTPFTRANDNSGKVIFNASQNKIKGLEYLKKSSNYEEKQELVMVYENKNFDTKISKEIAKNIKEYLGIKVVCTGYTKDELEKVLKEGNYDIIFSKNDEEYGDIYKFFTKWTSYSKDNIYGYKSSDYDKTIEKALMEKTDKNKVTIYNHAQSILAKDLPCIPIYIGNTVICKRENIKDIYLTKSGNLVFDYAYKEAKTDSK
ncbi:peptide ABC transporter substrate-binding protein [Clostridium estertheticum]|uniref:peptide ABC transporter substrate-binding protein n=1 Tax=Clostridium estertheticum TaxID=238834 RepID=UPI0013EED6E0|nr:peptide ABC transporter substrate-binding protein [Clostridium estertheticum]MBZ9609108.1 peptide ABC transporter substrate-binding protein [Clostridium estertheticum]